MKNCPNCGKEVEESSLDCPHCSVFFFKLKPKGSELTTEKTATESPSVPRMSFPWVVISVILGGVIFFFWLDQKVQEKTKGARVQDVGKIANHLALKLTGMDNKHFFSNLL